MNADVVLMMADGLEECEALNTLDVLRRGGVNVATVSINGKKHVIGAHDIGIDCDMDIADLFGAAGAKAQAGSSDADGEENNRRSTTEVAEKLQMLILPGGMPGTTNLASCAPLISLIAEMNRQEKWLAAICAAPSVYAQCGVLTGHEATCYPGFEEVLLDNGAHPQEKAVVIDEHFITSRGLGTAISFALTLVKVLQGEVKAYEVRDSIISRDAIF